MGDICQVRGEHQSAIACYEQVLKIAQDTGDQGMEASALHKLGDVHKSLGSYQQALHYIEQSLAIAKEKANFWATLVYYSDYRVILSRRSAIKYNQQHLALLQVDKNRS
ncbi:tetratricopeptide repeat protein [Nostoc sp. CHAB 5784]|nr:tetratricopeptide repeat protein [Nostoc mirabile CHAB5784]